MDNPHNSATSVLDDSQDGEPIESLTELFVGVEAFIHAVALKFGVSTSESIAVRELSIRGSLTPSEIAQRTDLTSSSVTNLIDRLERAGQVRRRAHPDDRRSVLVDLTDEGREGLEWTRSLLVHAYDGVPEADLARTMDVLRKISVQLLAQAALISTNQV